VPAHAVAVSEEARAERVVGPPASDRLEDALEVGRVVLAVPIQVDGGGVALVAGDLEPRAKRGAKAARDRMRVDPRLVLPCDPRRPVPRAVVDEQSVDGKPARALGNPGEHRANGGLLVTSDDDRNCPA
jgi:hypothetical protein